MNLQRYVRLLEGAFIVNLVLMAAVLVDFLFLGHRLVTFLVGLYAALVVLLLVAWAGYEVRLRRERSAHVKPAAARPSGRAGPINR